MTTRHRAQREAHVPWDRHRRRHLHRIIDGNGCALTQVTERRGRPFTLVCTKTTASYLRARKTHKQDMSNLSRIKDLEKLGV